MKSAHIIFATCILLFVTSLHAENYEISVTRKGSNLYKIDGEDTFIHTRYCYEYVYYEDSFLRMRGYSGEIVFLDAGEKCDVIAVYGASDQDPGTYSISVTREEDDWYEVDGQQLFIKTSSCLSLALGEDAVLRLNATGYGELHVGREKCSVEGVYSKLRL